MFNLRQIDISKLQRDYSQEPLKRGEFLTKCEAEYLYLGLNFTFEDLSKYLGLSSRYIRSKIINFGIKKDSSKLTLTRKLAKQEKYGDPNYNNREKAKKTNLERFGAENAMQNTNVSEKCYFSNLKNHNGKHFMQTSEASAIIQNLPRVIKYGKENIFSNSEYIQSRFSKKYLGYINPGQVEKFKEKAKKTCLKRYGTDNYSKTEECQAKIRKTNLERYGVNCYFESSNYKNLYKNKEFLEAKKHKEYQTKKQNNSFNKSTPEKELLQLLLQKFPDTISQYRSDVYPFNCDFYIPSKDLYIEYQGSWTHGYKPFVKDNKECQEQLKSWKKKVLSSIYYKNAIETWTVRDPLKRKTAKENNLNYLEFFTEKNFMEWYDKQ